MLVDPAPSVDAWDEGCRVRIRGETAVAFGKQIDEPAIDCGAFLLSSDVFEAQRHAAAEGDHTLAGAVSRLATFGGLRVVRIDERTWWQDIDTPEDLRIARSQLQRSLTKDGDGPVSRYLNRPVSTRISMALAPLRISPDLISLVSVGLALVAAWLLATGRGILGGVLVHLASVLDGVDGETARLLVRAGPRGAMLDGMLDRLGDAALMGGLGVWALNGGSGFSPRARRVAHRCGHRGEPAVDGVEGPAPRPLDCRRPPSVAWATSWQAGTDGSLWSHSSRFSVGLAGPGRRRHHLGDQSDPSPLDHPSIGVRTALRVNILVRPRTCGPSPASR